MGKKGLLLVNLGSPDSPTKKDVKPYLADFLGLVCSIIPLTKSVLSALGTSKTLESIKNSAK